MLQLKQPRNLLTLQETWQRLRISRSGLYRLLERGELSSVHIGGKRLIFQHVLDEYLRRLEGSSHGQTSER